MSYEAGFSHRRIAYECRSFIPCPAGCLVSEQSSALPNVDMKLAKLLAKLSPSTIFPVMDPKIFVDGDGTHHHICPREAIQCECCEENIKRNAMDQLLKDNAVTHMACLFKTAKDQRQQLDDLSKVLWWIVTKTPETSEMLPKAAKCKPLSLRVPSAYGLHAVARVA